MAQPNHLPAHTVNSVTVVNPNFLVPNPVDLVIVKKLLSLSNGTFTVTDINGNVIFKIKGHVLSVHERRVLVDATHTPILTFQKKLRSLHHRWVVFKGESSDSKDIIFTAKQSSALQMKTSLDVFLAYNEEENVCDFKVKGSWFDRSCNIYARDGSVIAEMHKRHTAETVLLGKDTFIVTVHPNVDHAFIVALILILHEINSPLEL